MLINGIYELELAHQFLAGLNKLPRGNYQGRMENTTKLVGRTLSHVPFNVTLKHLASVDSQSVLRDLARSGGNQTKYFSHLTGFSSNEKFGRVLEFASQQDAEKTLLTGK